MRNIDEYAMIMARGGSLMNRSFNIKKIESRYRLDDGDKSKFHRFTFDKQFVEAAMASFNCGVCVDGFNGFPVERFA